MSEFVHASRLALEVGMLVQMRFSPNGDRTFQGIIERLNPTRAFHNEKVFVQEDSIRSIEIEDNHGLGPCWGDTYMKILNTPTKARAISGPGYYPGPSPVVPVTQVPLAIGKPGYYSCANPNKQRWLVLYKGPRNGFRETTDLSDQPKPQGFANHEQCEEFIQRRIRLSNLSRGTDPENTREHYFIIPVVP